MLSASPAKPIRIRQVWQSNLESEFELIKQTIHRFPYISMDTEFPGVIYRPNQPHHLLRHLHPSDHYQVLKANVDALKLIQVGLTLTDADGNLPDFGHPYRFIWEFNFKDFDIQKDPHAYDSIELLRQQGIDFDKNKKVGIESYQFRLLMLKSGLVCNDLVKWVTFHSAYDFGYLVKVLTGNNLPDDIGGFLHALRFFFGEVIYDVKYIMRFCDSLYGGLERVANTLKVNRVVGKGHQAGSDSLLTWQVFQKIRDINLLKDGLEKHAGLLFEKHWCIVDGLLCLVNYVVVVGKPSSKIGYMKIFRREIRI